MNNHRVAGNPRVVVYLCECGPIIKEAVNLDALASRLLSMEAVKEVRRYPTLCSEEGRHWLENDLKSFGKIGEIRPVFVGCSVREHEATFQQVCQNAGINPYLMAMANIREQNTWVTPDPTKALEKAAHIAGAAVFRVLEHEALNKTYIDSNPNALIIGAGVAGLTAAKLLADADRKVTLVEREPVVGGRVARLSDIYPHMECASCMLEPLIDEVIHHPNIELVTYSEVQHILGFFGSYTVTIRRRARRVSLEGCYGCRTCHQVCPVEVPNQFDEGLSLHKAIFIPYEGNLPNASLIDETSCLRFHGKQCDECARACPFGNIDFSEQDEFLERKVGAIILATGGQLEMCESFKDGGKLISAMAFERLINSAGPTKGKLFSTERDTPPVIALLECADEKGRPLSEKSARFYNGIYDKFAHQVSEKYPHYKVSIISRRTQSRDNTISYNHICLSPFDDIVGVHQKNDNIEIVYRKDDQEVRMPADLVVLAPDLHGARGCAGIADMLRVDVNQNGFFTLEHESLSPFKTRVGGILTAGDASGMGTIPKATTEGAAAAGCVLSELVPGRQLLLEPMTAQIDQASCSNCWTCVTTCLYKAIHIDVEKMSAVVNDLLCRGCGSCAACCPTGAIDAKHFTKEQLEAEIQGLLE